MFLSIVLSLTGALTFLFLYWRRLREDYPGDVIFGSTFFILAGLAAGYLAAVKFFPAWFFWAEGFGAFFGFALAIFTYNLRFFETFEAGFLGFLPWLGIYYLVGLIAKPGIPQAVMLALTVGLITLFVYLDHHYKTFRWYRSGRIGLSGLLTAGVFFIVRAAIATLSPGMVSFAGRSEVVLSAISAFAIFLLIYNLGRQDL